MVDYCQLFVDIFKGFMILCIGEVYFFPCSMGFLYFHLIVSFITNKKITKEKLMRCNVRITTDATERNYKCYSIVHIGTLLFFYTCMLVWYIYTYILLCMKLLWQAFQWVLLFLFHSSFLLWLLLFFTWCKLWIVMRGVRQRSRPGTFTTSRPLGLLGKESAMLHCIFFRLVISFNQLVFLSHFLPYV